MQGVPGAVYTAPELHTESLEHPQQGSQPLSYVQSLWRRYKAPEQHTGASGAMHGVPASKHTA